ncbi:hypothetical protein [Actinacidiphila yeochonensis]|uniref:hypothetical protein n=1 Tax=Actinacidiphila yeochonensis TaxID=89050 RepID=UPI00055B4E1C|nr:hypothetical protein [Actinacidiphila yeochonensis]
MRTRYTALGPMALAVGVVLVLAGCGGGSGGSGDSDAKAPTTTAATHPANGTAKGGGDSAAEASATPSSTPTTVLAQLKGEDGVLVSITSAVRDSGGFVTVQGEIVNDGSGVFNATTWRGEELALVSSGPSVAGAVLVDEAAKKRYYVLRDTEGKCLCTMGLIEIRPKETRPFFAQFPAPPAGTTSVEFELPTMPPAKIPLSEG